MLDVARKDDQIVTQDWQFLERHIDGVAIRELKHFPRDHGVITEMYRADWDPTGLPVVHSYQSRLFPGAIGAWSCHAKSLDPAVRQPGTCQAGAVRWPRRKPAFGMVNELLCGDVRPMFVVLPTGIWHGLHNLGANDALMINFPPAPITIATQIITDCLGTATKSPTNGPRPARNPASGPMPSKRYNRHWREPRADRLGDVEFQKLVGPVSERGPLMSAFEPMKIELQCIALET